MIHGELFKCPDCGEVFDHPKREDHVDEPENYVCPFCGSDEWEQADVCDECGEVFYRKDMNYGLCPDCLERAARERAYEYVMHDSEVTDSFAWWLHCREGVIV